MLRPYTSTKTFRETRWQPQGHDSRGRSEQIGSEPLPAGQEHPPRAVKGAIAEVTVAIYQRQALVRRLLPSAGETTTVDVLRP